MILTHRPVIFGGLAIQFIPGLDLIFLLIGLEAWLASPILVKIIYSGKLWNQQAWLCGFEGYCDIATVETSVFGYNMG